MVLYVEEMCILWSGHGSACRRAGYIVMLKKNQISDIPLWSILGSDVEELRIFSVARVQHVERPDT